MMYAEYTPTLQHDKEVGVAYKRTHSKHPMTRWVNASIYNYWTAGSIGLILCKRYTREYARVHACEKRIRWLMNNNLFKLRSRSYDGIEQGYTAECNHHACALLRYCDTIPQCMPDHCKKPNAFDGYNTYYETVKVPMLSKLNKKLN